MSNYILAIDQGTTSSRAIVFNKAGEVVHTAQLEFTQLFPHDGWVEHQPDEIWQTVLTTCRQVMSEQGISADQIISIGITNQRETTVVWDRATGQPVYNAIVWQDRRTAKRCQQLNDAGWENTIRQKTGLLIDPYFSATKLQWILDKVPGVRERAERGELAFGTIDSFLLWQLTAGRSHLTDATNAARTMLFNIHSQQWDSELLDLFNIPAQLLPEVMDSSADFGTCNTELFAADIPIQGIAGDQQASLFGQACFQPGMVKSTYGTGCFLVANTGEQALMSENRLLTTMAYRLNGKPTYALEGSIFSAGATVQWLRDGLKVIDDAQAAESMTAEAKNPLNVFLVPAFTGLGAPHWDPNARGAILGLTRDNTMNDIVTAALQAVGFQTKDLQQALEKDGLKPKNFRVDGGMANNNYVLQFLADMLDCEVDRPQVTETTALGAAYLAGLQAGVFSSLEDIANTWHRESRFVATIDADQRAQCYRGWQAAVRRVTCSVE